MNFILKGFLVILSSVTKLYKAFELTDELTPAWSRIYSWSGENAWRSSLCLAAKSREGRPCTQRFPSFFSTRFLLFSPFLVCLTSFPFKIKAQKAAHYRRKSKNYRYVLFGVYLCRWIDYIEHKTRETEDQLWFSVSFDSPRDLLFGLIE